MSRDVILKRISQATAHMQANQDASDVSPMIPPGRGTAPSDIDLFETFRDCLARNGAEVARCTSTSDIPGLVSELIKTDGIRKKRIRVTEDARLQKIDWNALPQSESKSGPWCPNDTHAISHAFCAISDTGSLVMASGADNPTSLNFLSEHHLIVVAIHDLLPSLSDVMAKLEMRNRDLDDGLMRAINIISGASRTADIGGQIVNGAHGPRQLSVIVYDRE